MTNTKTLNVQAEHGVEIISEETLFQILFIVSMDEIGALKYQFCFRKDFILMCRTLELEYSYINRRFEQHMVSQAGT